MDFFSSDNIVLFIIRCFKKKSKQLQKYNNSESHIFIKLYIDKIFLE